MKEKETELQKRFTITLTKKSFDKYLKWEFGEKKQLASTFKKQSIIGETSVIKGVSYRYVIKLTGHQEPIKDRHKASEWRSSALSMVSRIKEATQDQSVMAYDEKKQESIT